MSGSANVRSIQALAEFKAALATFSEQARDALSTVDAEVQRLLEWLESDRPLYWQRQVRVRGEEVAQAKVELSRCRMFKVSKDHVPDCTEQKVALRRAQERLDEAEQKVKKVRQWSRLVQEALDEYQGQTQQLEDALDGDLSRAAAALERMIGILESYASASSEPLSSADGGQPTARPSSAPETSSSQTAAGKGE